MSDSLTFVIDLDSRQPGCVLIQAAYGCDHGAAGMFPTRSWLLAPTPNMVRMKGTREQWRKFTAELETRFGKE